MGSGAQGPSRRRPPFPGHWEVSLASLLAGPRLPEALEVAGRLLPLEVQRRRGVRRIRLRADGSRGIVSLSLPPRGGVAEALKLIAANQAWLAAEVAGWPRPLPFVPGAVIPFDGATLAIDWAPDHPRRPERIGDRLRLGGPAPALPGRVERWLKAAALADLEAATLALAATMDRPVAQVRIGDPRARWGSCATARVAVAAAGGAAGGRIAYSWRLILAPRHVRQHVVAHEVAHLVHAHHGPAFHALLARLDANAEVATRWLRAHGRSLHWVGRE